MKFDKDTPLHPEDNPQQTYGCRHSNADSCKCMNLAETCAFVRSDKICVKPPNRWKKTFEQLKNFG